MHSLSKLKMLLQMIFYCLDKTKIIDMKYLIQFLFLSGMFSFFSISKGQNNMENLFSEVFFDKKVNDNGCFFYKTCDTMMFENIFFRNYVLGNEEDNIEGYWGFNNDTVFFIPKKNSIGSCIEKYPFFVLDSITKVCKFNVYPCEGKWIIYRHIETYFVKLEEDVYYFKQTSFNPSYFNEIEIENYSMEDLKKYCSIRDYKFSFKRGIIEYNNVKADNTEHWFPW